MPRGTSIYDEAELQGRLWLPTNISSLAGWWDASDTTTMTFGTGISRWNSKVGSAYVAQATAAAQPTYTPTSITGAPAVVFTPGTSQQSLRYVGTPAGFNAGINAMTMVVSGYVIAGSSTFRYAVYYGTSTGTPAKDGRMILAYATTNYVDTAIYGGLDLYPAQPTTPTTAGLSWLNNSVVATISIPAGASVNITGSANGYDATSASIALANVSANFVIGAATDGTSFGFNGFIHDVMFFNEALSAANVRRVEGYCAWKANTQNKLAPTHPFKNRPPMIGG